MLKDVLLVVQSKDKSKTSEITDWYWYFRAQKANKHDFFVDLHLNYLLKIDLRIFKEV